MKVKTTQYIDIPLKELRGQAELSLRKLSELSGVSFAYISKIENGLTTTMDTWDRLKPFLPQHRDVAQLVEQRTDIPQVAGSNPAIPTN